MKKAVFLFLFIVCLSCNTTLNAANEDIYNFEDYQIRCETYYENSNKGYHISKLGSNTFNVDIIYEGHQVYISGVTEMNDKHVFYGYTHPLENERETYYDYFVLVLDQEGNEELLLLEELNALEEVRRVVEIDNIMLIYIEQTYVFRGEQLIENYFIAYDFEHNYLGTSTVKGEIERVLLTDHLFIYDFDWSDDYDGAITADLEVLTDDILDLTTDQVFFEETTILFVNDALLNESKVTNGVTVSYPGKYYLEYNDYTYTFIIEPIITGVIDNEVYTSSVTPVFEMGNAYLNDDLFISGTEITEPGNYTLKVVGVNGYTKEINFTINAYVEGVLNNQVYDEKVTITFDGEGYLNNTYIESPYTIEGDGDYILKVTGAGNYLQSYNFQVETEEEQPTFIDFIQKFDVVILGVVVIGGLIILKKK